MDMKQLKEMSVEEAIALINVDLSKLRAQKLLTNEFSNKSTITDIKCSWSSISKYFRKLGYELNRSTYVYEKVKEPQMEVMEEETVTELSKEDLDMLKYIKNNMPFLKDLVDQKDYYNKDMADFAKASVGLDYKVQSLRLRHAAFTFANAFAKKHDYMTSGDVWTALILQAIALNDFDLRDDIMRFMYTDDTDQKEQILQEINDKYNLNKK